MVLVSNSNDFGFGTQIRKSPFFDATVKWGAKDFSVYNHMYIPRDFGNPEENYKTIKNTANYALERIKKGELDLSKKEDCLKCFNYKNNIGKWFNIHRKNN